MATKVEALIQRLKNDEQCIDETIQILRQMARALQHVIGHGKCYCQQCKAYSHEWWEPEERKR